MPLKSASAVSCVLTEKKTAATKRERDAVLYDTQKEKTEWWKSRHQRNDDAAAADDDVDDGNGNITKARAALWCALHCT